jgi:hypothetical protein
MKYNFDNQKIELTLSIIQCFLNQANIELINLLSKNGELKKIDIYVILKSKYPSIGSNITKLCRYNIMIKENQKGSWSYKLNKELVEAILNITNILG